MKIAIIGANGQLGSFLISKMPDATAFTRNNLNILSHKDLYKKLRHFNVVINCAAFTDTKKAEVDKNNMLVNYKAVKKINRVCRRTGALFIHISSLSVFEPSDNHLNGELDFLHGKPKTKYGISKWKADKYLYSKGKNFLVARPSWLHSSGKQNFITKLNSFGKSEYSIVTDDIGQFTSGRMILNVIERAIEDKNFRGFINVSSNETISRFDLYDAYCQIEKKDVKLKKVSSKDINFDLSKINYQFMDVSKYEKEFGHKNVNDLIKDWIKEEEWKQ